MTTAIEVEGLGKRYRIGMLEQRPDTLVGTAMSWLRSPATNLRRLRRLTSFDGGDEADVLWALRDVSFRIEAGDVWGIVGRNGAGKSTLLKILSRITAPSAGRVRLRGRVASLLEVGTGFHPELTGRENTYLNGTILGMSKAEVDRSFDEIVAFAEVERFIDTPVKRYSSGMNVRLAFAVAAHLEAEILLVDEVLAVGDLAFQRKCLGKMEDVAGKGRTVILVSHNMSSIRRLCRRGLLLEHGTVATEGSIESVVDLYFENSLDADSGELEQQTSLFTVRDVKVEAVGRPVIQTYDTVDIKVTLEARKDIRAPGLYAALLGADHFRLAGLDLRDFVATPSMSAGETVELGFRIADLPLMAGRYHLELYVKDMAGPIVEKVERWFPFDVIETEVYGQKAPTRWHGRFALDAEPLLPDSMRARLEISR